MKSFIILGKKCRNSYLLLIMGTIAISDIILVKIFKIPSLSHMTIDPKDSSKKTTIYLFNYMLNWSVGKLAFGILSYFLFRERENDRKNKHKKSFYLIVDILGISEENKKEKDESNKKIKKKSLLLTIIISILDYLGNYIYIFFNNQNTSLFLQLSNFFQLLTFLLAFLFGILMCYKLFNFRIYKHHILSSVIVSLALILLLVNEIINKRISFNYVVFIFFLIRSILYMIYDSFVKYICEFYFVPFYNLLIIEGITIVIFTFIILLISRSINCFGLFAKSNLCEKGNKIFYFSQLINQFKEWKTFLYFAFSFIFLGIYSVLVIIINIIFSPLHLLITDIFSLILLSIWLTCVEHLKYGALEVIGHILLLFSILLFNELIIINACGLQENTVMSITNRSILDTEIMSMNDIELEGEKRKVSMEFINN